MSDWYILNPDKTTRKAITQADREEAYKVLGSADKIVAQDQIGNTWISTVFLGLDHSCYVLGPPILFETMVFRDGSGEECERYSSYEDAVAGHKSMCDGAQSGISREELEKAKIILEELLNTHGK